MRVLWISAVIVLVDQCSKVAVLNLMYRSESIPLVGNWLKFTFTENPGIAFGLQFGPRGLMAVLSIAVTALVVWYIWQVRRAYVPYRASLALILGGALGNIIDRTFYGVLLDYGPLFGGRVVDFIHVDIGYVSVPAFVPFLGGVAYPLFPIWNVADMFIVAGVVGILVFQHGFHAQYASAHAEEEEQKRGAESETAVSVAAASYAPAPQESPPASSEERPA